MPIPVHEATDQTFDALVRAPRGELVIVDFWGDHCPNCEVFERDRPLLLEALGDAPARLVRVDAYAHPELARDFALYGVPTFLLFRDGKLLGRMSQYHGQDYWLGVVRERL